MATWMIAALLAFLVKGLTGFGDGLVFSTFLSFFSGYVDITPTATVLSLPSNLIMTWQNRKKLKAKVFLPVMAMLLTGDLIGAFLLKNLDTHLLKILFGFLIIGLGIEMYLREKSTKKLKSSKLFMTLIGVVSGILSGLFGIGALLTAYFSRATEDTEAFRANICIVFSADNLLRLTLYGLNGILTGAILKRSFMLFPIMLAALLAGVKSSAVLNEKTVKRMVTLMLIISGAVLVWTNL